MAHTIRPLAVADLAWTHSLNQEHAVELSSLPLEAFETLVAKASHAVVIDEQAAFLLAYDQSADYDGHNYLWFKARYPRFLYVDRVAVAANHRRMGLAGKLYQDLFEKARTSGQEFLVCEVNADPPNPSSDAFHKSLGFEVVGRESLEGYGKTVSYLCCRLS